MKIKDILADGRPSVSFEVFPPRKDAPFGPVKEAVSRLARQKPSFMSVTYGASGNAQANTVAIASFVQACGVPALAHLTCVASTRDRIAEEVSALCNTLSLGLGLIAARLAGTGPDTLLRGYALLCGASGIFFAACLIRGLRKRRERERGKGHGKR